MVSAIENRGEGTAVGKKKSAAESRRTDLR
jgi:hypothetical protein